MITPGFQIKNDTQWPLIISLNQVGPLYYELVQPGQVFRRDTGAVWFTVKARISPNNTLDIDTWDCVWPIAAIVGGVLLGAVTGGYSAFAGVAGSLGASALVSGGALSLSSIVIEGTVAGALATMTPAMGAKALADIFEGSSDLSSAGEYAGPPWPFREDMNMQTITGGPKASIGADGKIVLSKGEPLRLNGSRY
ncbi:hypothetical protein [Flavobacterium sp.]|uniref:hypothetical protein n=1 Tax=Flavobacterium sp. TaxID=239 RepID=UPI0026052808|nr:hypothetical protein [Flavobacterium sp.]